MPPWDGAREKESEQALGLLPASTPTCLQDYVSPHFAELGTAQATAVRMSSITWPFFTPPLPVKRHMQGCLHPSAFHNHSNVSRFRSPGKQKHPCKRHIMLAEQRWGNLGDFPPKLRANPPRLDNNTSKKKTEPEVSFSQSFCRRGKAQA